MLSFLPRDVLDEIWDLIESVSEGFTYSCKYQSQQKGFEMPENYDGSLGEQGHLWVNWLYPLDLYKS